MYYLWSAWNFSWFSLCYLGYLPFNYALQTSVFVTSIMGGFTIYIYPRKIVIRVGKIKWNVPYPLLIFSDLVFHQIPFLYVLNNKKKFELKTCGAMVLAPLATWHTINYFTGVGIDKIYGVKMKYLLGASFFLFGGHSYCYHFLRK